MRKPDFCICENKDADQLRGNRKADQGFVFATRILQSLYFLNPKFQASGHLWLYSPFCVEPGPKSPKTGFLTTRLLCKGRQQLVICLSCIDDNEERNGSLFV